LKSMLCIHSDISNKPDLTADLNTSTSHASNSELDSVGIKHVIVDAACSKNSCKIKRLKIFQSMVPGFLS
jgi:hypothetical protein